MASRWYAECPPEQLLLGTFTCDHCSFPSVGVLPYRRGSSVSNVERLTGGSPGWLPVTAMGRDFPDFPEHIAGAASEAHICRDVNALRAAVMLARSVIEATAKEKGITQQPLVKKIDKLYDEGIIREYIRDVAHEVRYLGNDMAHGDFVDPVSAEDADLVLALMAEVLDEVFQSPARVARARANRAARKQSESS